MGALCSQWAKCPSEKREELCEQLQDSGVGDIMSLVQGTSLRSLQMRRGKGMGRGRPRMQRKARSTYIQVKENSEPTLPLPALVFLPHHFLSLPSLSSVMKSLLVGTGVGTGIHYG